MLEHSLVESGKCQRTRKPLTVMLSTALHVGIVGGLLVLPLVQTQALQRLDALFLLRPPELSANKPPVPQEVLAPAVQSQIVVKTDAFIAPTKIPDEILKTAEAAPTEVSSPAPPPNSVVQSVLNAIRQSKDLTDAPAPPPPAIPEAPAPKVVRVSAGLQSGNLIYQPKPVYPPLARTARVQGVVVLEAFITVDGSIENLRVISGHPLLTAAAIDAVKLWRYRPTLLSGQPVEVVTTVTVTFSMK